MSEETQVTTTDAGNTSQPLVGENFFQNYELVDGSGNKVDDPIFGTSPEKPATQSQTPAPVQPAAAPAQPAQAQPQPTSGQQPNLLDDTFFKNDNGKKVFNADSAISFLTNSPQGEFTSRLAQQPPAPAPAAPVQPGQPAPAPEPTYEESLRANMVMALRVQDDFIKQGYTPEQARLAAQNHMESFLEKHFLDRRFKEMEEKMTAKEKAIAEREQQAMLRPMSERNLMDVLTEYGKTTTPEKFKTAMFNPKYGGQFLNLMFDAQNPDKVHLVGKELAKEMDGWFTKFSANKQNLQLAALVTQAAIQRELMPSIVQHIRDTAQRQAASNKEAPKGGVSGLTPGQRGAQSASKTGFPELDKFFQ